MTGPVVVGVDGSPAGTTAAWWAAREGMTRRLPVLLVHSWTTQPLNVPVAQEALSKQHYGQGLLLRIEAELLHRYGELSLTTELVEVSASQALLEHSERAALLVLGSRGHGSAASFLLGSHSLHILGLSRCPAVIVRAGDPAVGTGWGHPGTERGDVVVGVEPGPGADALLEFAFTTAEAHGCGVHAVRALPHQYTVATGRQAEQGAVDRARLTASLAPWREKFPGVPLVDEVTAGPAAQVLLSAATRGRLTVVGRRRHSSHLTWKLGPVAHAVLHHAPCPVAVVPHD
ncbi:universal stress protein [Streptomyces sp. SLBN-31]|uniref:universal stress protein n=1 Tax=Streptomyces sp. SLBN-31 TaxID=2768444 RepID=UPI00115262C4|nr:universal stress protein [Streptomyces sp. SLBN-31]TQJ86010.1 nucleotide-binding universal stress UspA family protein [Streptomyces sp. SLBN-31]